MALPVFTWHPDLGSQKSIEANIRETVFGDGYAQRAPNGINHLKEIWTVGFTGNEDRISPIQGFLEGVLEVHPFRWTTPEEKQILVIAKNFRVDRSKQGVYKIDCEFAQTFDYSD